MGDQILLNILSSIVCIYRPKMIWLSFIALLPAFVLSKSVVSADITEIQVCQYFDARIQRFEEKVKEMKEYVDVDSEFYRTLEASHLCDTVGRVAVPECVANHEGDECAAAKIVSIKKPLLRAIKVDKSGKEFFDYCKYIGYKNVLKTFLQTRKLMSGECGLPGQSIGDREPRNSLLLPLLVAGAYDPSSIWFQYFLCKDQQIYCYFFTQGWNQYEYGQYYLYENLLDDQTGIFAGSSDSNLATLALLGGLGGGSPGYYPSPSGYSNVPAGRKRRTSGNEECTKGDENCDRKRREAEIPTPCPEGQNCDRRRRQAAETHCPKGQDCDRKRRQAAETLCPKGQDCDRKRRQAAETTCPKGQDCDRKRRQAAETPCPKGQDCDRKRRQAESCPDGENCTGDRKRRSSNCRDPEDNVCCVDGKWLCF